MINVESDVIFGSGSYYDPPEIAEELISYVENFPRTLGVNTLLEFDGVS